MTTRLSIDTPKSKSEFEPLIVVFVESVNGPPWWRYHTLIAGTDSQGLGVSDPDFFCVYNFLTKKILWMTSSTPSKRGGHIFRIHDGVKARFAKVSDTRVEVTAHGGTATKTGIHQCTGSHVKCEDEVTLKLNSDNLAFPWDLPPHLLYESKNDIQWVGPKP